MGQVGELPIGRNESVKMIWETGHAAVANVEATHCNYDNSSCYKVKNVPVIFGLSSNTGYTSGGQNLTVHGYGFDSGNITATVDGVACNVTSYQKESFSCEIGSKSGPSVGNTP